MASKSSDDFDFSLIGTEKVPFAGYNSADDPTRLSPQYLVRGSQNVVLENTGNIANRPGLKRYDPANASQDPVVSSFDWNDVDGNTLLTRVLESGDFQFYRTSDQTWYTVQNFTLTDFSYAKWWDDGSKKELLIMVNGDNNIYAWSGGFTDSVGDVNADNSILITAGPFITTLAFTDVPDGVSAVSFIDEDSSFNDRIGAIVLEEQPENGSFLVTDLASDSPALGETAYIKFVTVLGAAAVPEEAQVLIGASKEETTTNLLGLLQDPGTNTATQVGFTNGDVRSLVDFSTYAIVPALESGSAETWSEQGFINDSSIVVNGTTYTYDLVAGRYLVNISGFPDTGMFGYAGITTSTNLPVDDNANDFVLVLNNQLIVCSYTSRVVYISADSDYTDFSNQGDFVAGDPDFFVLDEFPKGGVTLGSSAYIGAGTSSWYAATPNTPVQYVSGVNARTVITEVRKFAGAGLTAPLGKNFVTTLIEDIVFLGQDHQLRTLGIYRNVVQQKSPALSIDVRAELEEEDFTGGILRSIGEYTYIVSPLSGKTYLYQIRDNIDDLGNISSVRKWQPPQIWNISRPALVDGIVHGYSAETPQLYQLWDTDQWHDDTSIEDVFAPYISVARLAYAQFSERNKLGAFDKVFYEGYIAPYSDLQTNVYYDYRGATRLSEKVLSDEDNTPVLFGGEGVTLIGGAVIGNTTLGGGRRDEGYTNELPKFRAITNVVKDNCFEYQIELVSEELDSQWILIATGANAQLVTDNPVNLQTTY